MPKTLHFLWLKVERIRCYFGNTNIRPVFRLISEHCLFLPHPRSTVAVRFGLILLRISLFRDFTCNLSIFQEQLLSISRLFTVAKFSLDLECSVSVRKRLIPFLKKCQAAYQLPFFVTWVVSLVGLQFTSSNKRNVFLYLLEWLTFVRDGK